jgi:hypothetical protein
MRIPRQRARKAAQFRQQFDDSGLQQIGCAAHLSPDIRSDAVISSIGGPK